MRISAFVLLAAAPAVTLPSVSMRVRIAAVPPTTAPHAPQMARRCMRRRPRAIMVLRSRFAATAPTATHIIIRGPGATIMAWRGGSSGGALTHPSLILQPSFCVIADTTAAYFTIPISGQAQL